MKHQSTYRWDGNAWSTWTPGLIVILLDTSELMSRCLPGTSTPRCVEAAEIVNRIIDFFIQLNYDGDHVKDRGLVVIIGYSNDAEIMYSQYLSAYDNAPKYIEIIKKTISDGAGGRVEIDRQMPIWVEPTCSAQKRNFNCGFSYAKEIIANWKENNPKAPVPLTINISAFDNTTEQKLMTRDELKTIEIAEEISSIQFEGGESSHIVNIVIGNEAEYSCQTLNFLKLISSPLPQEYTSIFGKVHIKNSHCLFISEKKDLYTLIEYTTHLYSEKGLRDQSHEDTSIYLS